MHMADALVSPTVAASFGLISGAAIAYSIGQIKKEDPETKNKALPLMGVTGAFVFTAQMINIAIPGTGASGHIGGGILLSALLGPHAALLTIASILFIQSLLFADGGLLALGCNLFNMGVLTCLVAYPLFFKPLIHKGTDKRHIVAASVLSAVVGLQLGSLGVVIETIASGVTELPAATFLALMQPIHLLIGLLEGVITAAILTFLYQMRPELIPGGERSSGRAGISLSQAAGIFLTGAAVTGVLFSQLASGLPDGLEWSVERAAGSGELLGKTPLHGMAEGLQRASALLPDYTIPWAGQSAAGTAIAGILGGLLTLVLVGMIRFLLAGKKETEETVQHRHAE